MEELDEQLRWRVQNMLPQIPKTGCIPFLYVGGADENTVTGPGLCKCCGFELSPTDESPYICNLCVTAKNIALKEAGVTVEPIEASEAKTEEDKIHWYNKW